MVCLANSTELEVLKSTLKDSILGLSQSGWLSSVIASEMEEQIHYSESKANAH